MVSAISAAESNDSEIVLPSKKQVQLEFANDPNSLQAILAKLFSDSNATLPDGRSGIDDGVGNSITCNVLHGNENHQFESFSCIFEVSSWPSMPRSISGELARILPQGTVASANTSMKRIEGKNGSIDCKVIQGGVSQRLPGRPSMGRIGHASCNIMLLESP